MRRRRFIRNTGIGGAGILIGPKLFGKSYTANEMVNIGVIGCNGMGWSNVKSLHKSGRARCIAVCDIDQGVIDRRAKELAEEEIKYTTYTDYRKMLENPDIDAVVIGTPDHWHCKIMIDAVQAGKHVYVEKPIANTVEECRLMVDAGEKYGKMVQVGQWQRSGPHYREAMDIVRSGWLGKIRLVKCWAYQGWMKPVPVLPDTEAPQGVDYQMWLGPAPDRPFNHNRFHFSFRWFWDYAGGLMTDWGVHEIDIALYAMGVEVPNSVMASGGKFAYPDDASETPDTLQTVFSYDDFNLLWEHATGIDGGPYNRSEGIAFIGNNGTLVVNRGGYDVYEENEREGWSKTGQKKMPSIEFKSIPEGANYLDLHTVNFLDAIRDNDASLLHTNIRSGSIAAINANMGNIAYRVGEKLHYDKEKGQFKNNEKANEMLKAEYHNDWKKPVV